MEYVDNGDYLFRYMVSVGSGCNGWIQIKLGDLNVMCEEFDSQEDIGKIDMIKEFREGRLGFVFEARAKEPREVEVERIDDFLSVMASRRRPMRMIYGYTMMCTRVIRHAVKEENERRRFS